MALGPEFAKIAAELIEEFGGSVTFTFEDRDGLPVEPAEVKGLVEDKGLWLAGASTLVGNKKVTIAAQGIVPPESGDRFTFKGKSYTICDKGVAGTYAGDTVVIWECYGEG